MHRERASVEPLGMLVASEGQVLYEAWHRTALSYWHPWLAKVMLQSPFSHQGCGAPAS